MVTISPSEPLLAEAAFDAMTTATYMNGDLVATSLLDHIDSSYLDAGNRGEVAASLLLLLARDKAVKAPDRQDILPLGKRSMDPKNDGWTSGRIITALDFLRALLPSDHHRSLGQHKPSCHVEGKDGETLEEAFTDGFIWFNHFIKVNDFSMVNRQYLSCLISRGAAIICADNHRGVDLVIPVLFNDSLEPESVSAILIQVKNDASFTHNVCTALFDLMDPYEVNLFSKGETPSPITRLVFALASKRADVMFPSPGCRSNRYVSNDKYTAYDIWVAGVTPESFGVISQDSVQTYNSLLQRSINAFNGYGLFDHSSKEQVLRDGRTSARRRMHPGASSILEHQQNYVAFDSGQSPCVELDDNEEE
ncbi:hypothetical protein CVT26_013471 [Gymnopilus dilepis]|uniref:Uncharacterized protein n=1 Tax=Gymnopilus dilepis TaxID=231916 RepID=A0A409YWX7_9AGAR|nr:hypothetical protein CVT26_013471 [Gymnopilus dilepis]